MSKACEALKEAAKKVWRWFFPEEIEVPDCVIKLLEAVYPNVDWERVSFYEGIPHVFNIGSKDAITLPSSRTSGRINIYIKPGMSGWCSCTNNLDLYVHEGMHVAQIFEWLDGWGAGLARPFLILYVACFFDNFSYDKSPFEIPAYDIEKIYENCCSNGAVCPDCPPCDCSAGSDAKSTVTVSSAIEQLKNNCAGLVTQSSGMKFWDLAAECTPGLEYVKKAAVWIQEKFCIPFEKWNDSEWAQKLSKWIIKFLCSIRKKIQSDIPGTLQTDNKKMQPPESDQRPKINFLAILCFLGLAGAGLIWVIWGIWWIIRGLICAFGWILKFFLYIIYGLYYALWLIFWTAILIIGEILDLIVEFIGVIITGILWIVAEIICALAWIWEKLVEFWEWLKKQLGKICDWAEKIQDDCLVWGEEKKAECQKWESETKQECSEWESHSEKVCEKYEDQGYSTCDEWEDWGYNACCDWAPCSWFCDALVWISNWVCVAYVWVSNWVCVAWETVTTWICKAYATVVSWFCAAFIWVTTKFCVISMGVIKFLTCWSK